MVGDFWKAVEPFICVWDLWDLCTFFGTTGGILVPDGASGGS